MTYLYCLAFGGSFIAVPTKKIAVPWQLYGKRQKAFNVSNLQISLTMLD